MPIAFGQIPSTLRLPFAYAEFDPSGADLGLAVNPFTVLLCGQMLVSGTASPLTITRPTSAAQAKELYGAGSQLAQMVEAYLNANPVTKMLAVASVDLSEGVAATGTITLAGTVSAAAPLYLYIGGQAVVTAASVGISGGQVAANMAAAINSNPDLPVSATAENGVVTLTAKHAGECGNDIDLRLSYYGETQPGGLNVTFTAMSGGSGNPDAVANIAAWPTDQCHVIAWPWQDAASLAAFKDEMDSRWGPLRQNDGQGITVKSGTFGQVMSFAEDHNNRGLTVIASEGSPTPPWVDAAASAGVLAYYANTDPARGFNTLPIPGVLAPAESDRWSDFPEKNQALFEGVSTRYVDPDGNVCFSKVITTYRLSPSGGETQAYLSINSCFTLSFLRYDWNNYMKVKYPRHKLAGDEDAARFGAGQPIMTPKLAKAELISRFSQWLQQGLVEGSAQFAADLITEINTQNTNRLDVFMRPNLVNQFEICGTLIRHIV